MAREESGSLKTCDFLVETKGKCFLCLIRVEHQRGFTPAYSIHCLSRYLEMNMTKVLNEKGPIPAQLLEKAQRSDLKVELCQQCSGLTESFAVLHQCKICFNNPGNLRRHLKTIHLKLKEFECELCHRKFASKTGLGYHHQAAHVRKRVKESQLTNN